MIRTSAPVRTRRRGGFTLLELLLAALIAALLMAALYTLMQMTMQQTQDTRDAVESEDLARGVFNKLSLDLNGTLTPLPPKSGGNTAASGGTTASSTTSGTTTNSTPAASTTSGTGTSTSTSSSTGQATGTTAAPTDNTSAFLAAPAFQGGVYCLDSSITSSPLVLFLGRTPEAFRLNADPNAQVRADQRQVMYKYFTGVGLFRVERPWVLASGMTLDFNSTDPDAVLLAPEVTNVLVEFTDGPSGNWTDTWDGTVPGADGVTPLGPPRAIRVTLTLSILSGKGGQLTKQLQQVLVVRSAPGTNTVPLIQAPTAGASGSSGGTTTSSGSTGSTAATGATGGSVTGANASGSSGGAATGGTGGTGGGGGTGGTGGGGGGAGGTGGGGGGGTGGK